MSRSTTGGFGMSSGCLKMDNYSGDMDITGQADFMFLPVIDLTTASSNTWLRFNVAYAQYNSGSQDNLQFGISNDCGITWDVVYNKTGAALSTAPPAASAWTPQASQWRTDSVSLAAYAGQQVIIAFVNNSNFGNNLYIDDVFVGDLSSGINDITASNFVSIAPNPVSTELLFTFNQPANEKINITISSIEGKTVSSYEIPGNQSAFEADVTRLESGAYLVKVRSGKEEFTKVVMKQ